MATNEGGATPMNVPSQNGLRSTPMTGETILMNQLGRKGGILKWDGWISNQLIFMKKVSVDNYLRNMM